MVMSDSKTNIQVSREMRDFLSSRGRKGESYDDILKKLLRTTYDWDNVYKTSIPVQTREGIQYIDVIMPKLSSIYIDSDEYCDVLSSICEKKDIEMLDESEVPFFNEHF